MPVQKHRSKLNIDANGYESATRGDPMFPCSAYWWELTNPLFDEIPWHWHEDFEVLFVKSGQMRLCINDNTFNLYEGEGAFLNSNVVHSIRTAGKKTSTLNSLVFNTDILSGTAESVFAQKYVRPIMRCNALPFIPFQLDTEWMRIASQCVFESYTAFDEEKYGFELIIREKLSKMLYLIAANNQQIIEQQPVNEDKDMTRLKTMMSFLHQNYADRILLHQIAAAANISERECMRCFKKTIGESPIQYLIKYRVSVAASFLADSDMTITEICEKTGFDNPSHFSRVFKSYMKQTPSEYRKTWDRGTDEPSPCPKNR